MNYNFKHLILFLAPLMAIVALMYFMIIWTAGVSMTEWVGLVPSWKFIGLGNYTTLLGLGRFWVNLQNNVIWLATFILPTAAFGLLLAYGIELSGRAAFIWRPLFLYPIALSFVITGTLWAWMYDPGSGVINTILRALKLDFLAGSWIASPKLAIYCLVGTAIWQYTGFAMVLYLAAIHGIPPEIREAAMVDGASHLQIFRHIIVPNVGHATLIVVATLAIFSLKVFDLVWVMTMGAPGHRTEVLPYLMFIMAFQQYRGGVGTAISVIILLLAIGVVLPYARWAMKKWMG